ncbi:methyl-accepting chemotaxis protein [Chitinispirillales bacterium ANBcel5]|uniref:methyl-accepting chemotaxis protein n=1 Tax=Cellulosispirillum alkaliphilum TaxID=3039283 RepID=UPI002A570BA9|nr:methyl-accepting chemotaxis protein [Chitinispirillales bacterium ANBcel5]
MFNNLSLKLKLILFTGTLLLIMGVTLSFVAYRAAERAGEEIAEEVFEEKLYGDINAVRRYVESFYGSISLQEGKLVDKSGLPIENRHEMVDAVLKELGVVATIFVRDGQDFRRISTNIENEDGTRAVGTMLGTQSDAYQPVTQQQQYIGEARILGLPYLCAYDPIINDDDEVIGIIFVGVDKTEAEYLRSDELRTLMFQIAGAFFFVFIAALFVLFVIIKKITAPIVETTEMLKDIAQGEGDLTKRLKITTQDEIGELSKWFNVFVEKIQNIIKEVNSDTTALSAASEELSSSSTQIAANAEEMTAQSTTAASASEQATSNINTISAATEQISGSISTVATSIEEMNASLNEVSRNCQKESEIALNATEEAKKSKEIMVRLGTAAKSVDKIVEVINDIADQTNLLALNATIEAASAGDAGKGFAVVANEVKELAKQTANATKEISTQVEQMQTNTESAVAAIDSIAEVINEVNQISQTIVSAVEEQTATISEISSSVNGVNTGAQDVAKNVNESAQGLTEVAKNISGVNTAAQDTAQGINQVKESTSQLAELASKLETIVRQFKI